MCPGQKFAYAESVVAVVIILREFKLKMGEGQVVTPTFGREIHTNSENLDYTSEKIILGDQF